MPQDRQWPESHAEQTDVLPAVPAHPGPARGGHGAGEVTQHIATANEVTQHLATGNEVTQHIAAQSSGDLPTQQISVPPPPRGDEPPAGAGDGDGNGKAGRFRKPALIAGAVFGVLAVAYFADLLVTSGDVPRGVVVAGVEVGGLSHSQAEEKLRAELEPRLTQPVKYTAGEVRDSFHPKDAGLRLNWSSTLDQAGDQPLNPFTRIASFFSDREVGVVTEAEPNQLENAMAGLEQRINQAPVEGNVVFEGAVAKAVEPKNGQELEVEAAQARILAQWASGKQLNLPVHSTPVTVTAEAVQAALKNIAEPAVSGPVIVHGEGADGTLEPEEIAAGLSFAAENGRLVPKVDQKKIIEGVGPELAHTEREGKDAQIVFDSGAPTVVPSEDGNKIKWDTTLQPLLETLKKRDGRELTANYEKQPAKVTTEAANQLGIKEVIGEFTTGGFKPDSGVNIRRVAEEVNGAIVKPGETFSLNTHTGPRTAAEGYVPAGIIQDGAPGEAVGGGISQFATTLYNAYYFAGMKDAGHQEHSYYISRYPEGREATVFQNPDGSSVIDLAFTNDAPTGVAIQTIWTESSITVRLWGTKRYDVESVTGERTNFVEPQVKEGPAENCHPSSGSPGFTVTDTRVLRDVSTGAVVSEESRTVKYNPQNTIVCGRKNGH
ncbi:VanW family protein [Prauserella flavalba]|uniref:Vanomycin resistance protein VanB n=1 Tax=Prauserella flavalba TaxID=1477506 RepID=A0A318LIN7_9PSEU|nr:VanW family protein [Prauserella flavalba]PXY28830.1 vanomycin resistance protein VanB [Prauserella flavalba]